MGTSQQSLAGTTPVRLSDVDGEPACVGPITVPSALVRALQRLAEAAGVSDLVPVSIGATVLAGRLSPRGGSGRAHVVLGPYEAVTPGATATVDPGVSFRTALRRAAGTAVANSRAADTSVDVTILVSEDGRRLYVESRTDAAGAPPAQRWAQAFLHLLTCLADQPDAPMTAHRLPDVW